MKSQRNRKKKKRSRLTNFMLSEMNSVPRKKVRLAKDKVNKVVKNAMKNIDELTCSICIDYIVGCKIAVCGHSFCD